MSLVLPVVVAYRSYPWIKVALRSFRRHFPLLPMLVVDNNHDSVDDSTVREKIQAERAWLEEWVSVDFHSTVLRSTNAEKTHGSALDFARSVCLEHGIWYFLLFEPDCMVAGSQWASNLVSAVRDGAWMSGINRQPYGPIHPCPSVWDLRHVSFTFNVQERAPDRNHPRYYELFNEKFLKERVEREDVSAQEFWAKYWDTSMKAWFYIAVEGRDKVVENSGDLVHYWQGSTWNTDPQKCWDARIKEYLD